MMEQIKGILMITGLLWWCYVIFVGADWLGKMSAKRKGMRYQDMSGTWHDFRPRVPATNAYNTGKETEINIADNAEHSLFCDKCKPKKKWERLNVEDDTTDDV
jgi:hypothetical protein